MARVDGGDATHELQASFLDVALEVGSLGFHVGDEQVKPEVLCRWRAARERRLELDRGRSQVLPHVNLEPGVGQEGSGVVCCGKGTC